MGFSDNIDWSNVPTSSLLGPSHENMSQSYTPALRVGSVFGSGQPELRPHNGLKSTSYGNQCGMVKRGTDQPSAVQSSSVKQPAALNYSQPDRSVYSPLRRLQDFNTLGKRAHLEADLHARNHFRCASPISDDDDEFEAPSVQLPSSPANEDMEPFETLPDVNRNGFSPHSPDSLEPCSPIPNGYLHFESTLFDSSDVAAENQDTEHNKSVNLTHFHPSPKSLAGRTLPPYKPTYSSGLGKTAYKPTVFNLMSKTISELNPTLSPSALPEITMRDGWSMGEESDSDTELTSPDPGLISPAGTNSNVSLSHLTVKQYQ